MSVIVADTSAIVALIDHGDNAHAAMLAFYLPDPDRWTLLWAILPALVPDAPRR